MFGNRKGADAPGRGVPRSVRFAHARRPCGASRFPLWLIVTVAPLAAATTRPFPGGPPCNKTLQSCINGSFAGDTIDLASGIYTLPEIVVSKSLTLNGTGVASVTLQPDGAHRVLSTGQNLSGGVTLSNLTVTGGSCTGTQTGGGIFADIGTPLHLDTVDVVGNTCGANSGGGILASADTTLTNVNVVDNTDPGGAGGGLRATGNVTISGGKFQHNISFNSGGGMRVTGTLTMTNVDVIGNSHTNTASGANGGGICADGGLTLTGGSLTDNTSTNLGGAVFATTANITAATMKTNLAAQGGGIYATGTVTVADSQFDSNRAEAGNGGGIYAASSGLTTLTGTSVAVHTSFTSNIASAGGGGIFAVGALKLAGLIVFIGNQANGGNGGGASADSISDDGNLLVSRAFVQNTAHGQGGGAWATSAITLARAIVENNAGAQGGGLSSAGTLTLSSSSILSNQATSTEGGGLFACCGATILTDVIIEANSASTDGAGAKLQGAQILRSTISSNTGASQGGALFLSSDSEIRASIFEDNDAVHGGAIFGGFTVPGQTLRLFDSLFATNRGLETSDDIAFAGTAVFANNTFVGRVGPKDSVHLTGTIDAFNNVFAGYTASIIADGGSQDYNDFFNAPVSINLATTNHSITSDPKFVDVANRNFRPQRDSPLVDAGDNSAVPADLTADLDGFPRRVDAAVPDTGFGAKPIVDIGAYEENDDIFADGFDP